jgi:nifR3 family TIM-barrel protein
MINPNSKSIKIGSLSLNNRFFLAPLTKVTDLPFRLVVKKFQPSLMYTEMIDAKNLAQGKKSVIEKVNTVPDEKPIGLQLFGTQESFFDKSVRLYEDKFDLFDLNLGCPTDEAISQGAGVILLKRPQKMIKIIEAMVNATSKPVTVKIRLGLRDSSNLFKTVSQIESAGASAICLHGRLANDSYKIPANWDLVKKVKEITNIPIIGNGDIFNGKIANEYLRDSFADAVMIGRSAMHNPKIFQECLQDTLFEPTSEERWDWINAFFTYASENNFLRLIRFRKRISDFLHPYFTPDQRKYLRNESIKLTLKEIEIYLKNIFKIDINFLNNEKKNLF